MLRFLAVGALESVLELLNLSFVCTTKATVSASPPPLAPSLDTGIAGCAVNAGHILQQAHRMGKYLFVNNRGLTLLPPSKSPMAVPRADEKQLILSHNDARPLHHERNCKDHPAWERLLD